MDAQKRQRVDGEAADISVKTTTNGAGKTVAAKVMSNLSSIASAISGEINAAIHEPLIERVRKINPKVAHLLVSDASQADFMLSRTNIQKDFADKMAVLMLEDGFKLCADNSLEGGWGGPDWLRKYVEDSKKTRFGILVLEGGIGFFESTPCCDELYAAKKAGINLTRLNGASMRSGQYLWVEISDRVFDSMDDFERVMQPERGHQYTPIWFKATLGAFYDPALDGTPYTYHCVVPQGRRARSTGADRQRFS